MDRLNGEDIALNKLGDIEAGPAPHGKEWRPMNINHYINHYATKKSAAQSMLDVALLMANSSQLKSVLYVGPHYRFYLPLLVLLSLSITLQVMVGLLLVFIVCFKKWLQQTEMQARLGKAGRYTKGNIMDMNKEKLKTLSLLPFSYHT
ncbi:hypothetical protein OYC64_000044 [Pagothenia borchgrevinki]|uniref:Uncharacterized protein n=1 Tax=Pagothenia borchgrevinki TaxID=8213 RepID=A0ABD2HC63_PAGBO